MPHLKLKDVRRRECFRTDFVPPILSKYYISHRQLVRGCHFLRHNKHRGVHAHQSCIWTPNCFWVDWISPLPVSRVAKFRHRLRDLSTDSGWDESNKYLLHSDIYINLYQYPWLHDNQTSIPSCVAIDPKKNYPIHKLINSKDLSANYLDNPYIMYIYIYVSPTLTLTIPVFTDELSRKMVRVLRIWMDMEWNTIFEGCKQMV